MVDEEANKHLMNEIFSLTRSELMNHQEIFLKELGLKSVDKSTLSQEFEKISQHTRHQKNFENIYTELQQQSDMSLTFDQGSLVSQVNCESKDDEVQKLKNIIAAQNDEIAQLKQRAIDFYEKPKNVDESENNQNSEITKVKINEKTYIITQIKCQETGCSKVSFLIN